MPAFNRLAIHLRYQDVSNGEQYRFRSLFQQIGKSNQKPALAQTDGVVHVGEGEELDDEVGQGRPRTQFAITFLKKFEQTFSHLGVSLACENQTGECSQGSATQQVRRTR